MNCTCRLGFTSYTKKRNHGDKRDVHHHGFRTCNTQKNQDICCPGFRVYNTQVKPRRWGVFIILVLELVTQKKLGWQAMLVILVLQVIERKKTMMMSVALIVVVLVHTTQKKKTRMTSTTTRRLGLIGWAIKKKNHDNRHIL
jgi:hypothetical protein